MVFKNQAQAKQFFIDKILFQAQKERVSLSEAEKYMLGWTEIEEGFVINQKLTGEFDKETTTEGYERKISALIRHAYDSDIQTDPDMKKTYQAANRVLNQGDHYLLIMIKQAFRKGRTFSSWLKDRLLLIITSLGIMLLIVFCMALLSFVPKNYLNIIKQWSRFIVACVFYFIFFGSYSYGMHIMSKKKAHSLAKMICSSIVIAAVLIAGYSYLVVHFRIIDIAAHPGSRDAGLAFFFMVSMPLLIISVIIQDFAFRRGVAYDIITDLLEKLRRWKQQT